MNNVRSLAAYGFRPEFRTLSVCTTCLGLFDDDSGGQRPGQQQRCACRPSGGDRWPGYDYNERARLCDCCCRYLLRSGSRWSVWFCDECKERVIGLNEDVGFALIPIGRHSLMNGLGLRGGATEREIKRFADRVGGLSTRMDLLSHTWKPAQLRRELQRLGLFKEGGTGDGDGAGDGDPTSTAIPLPAYLAAVAEEDRTSGADHRLEAFRGLAGLFEVSARRDISLV
jgi:hypothetical protein